MTNEPAPVESGQEEAQNTTSTASPPPSQGRASFPEFIKPFEAVKRLEHYVGGSLQAKEFLADKMRDGELRAYARWTWETREPSLKKARSIRPDDAKPRLQIRRQRFIASPTWRDDLTKWKWRAGDFFCAGNKKHFRTIYKRVNFAFEDVEKMVRDAQEAMRSLKRGYGGAPAKENARDDVWFAIMKLYADEGKCAFSTHQTAVTKVIKNTNWTYEVESAQQGEMQKLSKEQIGKTVTAVRKRLGLTSR